jgi:hypothetical protein
MIIHFKNITGEYMQEKLSKLKELTDLFASNIITYKSQNYDEANLRVDFADKFFEILDLDSKRK